MSFAVAHSAHLIGLTADIVTVEVDISHGLHSFSVVGLGDRSVEESKDRISAAIKNSGYTSPKQKNQKVVVSLAPADVRKEGPSFDLAMTLAYLSAAGDITLEPEGKLFLGELSLEGHVRKVSGLLPILCQAAKHGFTSAFVPRDNITEASLAGNITTYVISSLQEIIMHLSGRHPLEPIPPYNYVSTLRANPERGTASTNHGRSPYDMSQIRGNETAKRGLEIAAAGGHNTLMCGPPGTGKTMLAYCFSSILPPLSHEQAIEVTSIHSAARILSDGFITIPPFRSPHHTASHPAIVGGGTFPKPGEITLAHHGTLFLDELPEFDRSVIEALRQPLEERTITISRARGTVTFPAHCIVIASMNPCPCGLGKERGCTCTERERLNYRKRVSGPIMDRMDIWIPVLKIDYARLGARSSNNESSVAIQERVSAAREIQKLRFGKYGATIATNSEMSPRDIEHCVEMDPDARSTLTVAAEKLELSGRAFHRMIKVAQTIADLAHETSIKKSFILEALQYRRKI